MTSELKICAASPYPDFAAGLERAVKGHP